MHQPFKTLTFLALGLLAIPAAWSQTITVDAARASNSIRPTEALGASVDRLPYGISDQVLAPETVKRVLEAGWQTMTYRQNTELHVEAWHWNPTGSWSDPAGRGYFVGSATPGAEPIRHTYGYPLPRRGVTRDDGTDLIGYSRLTDGDLDSFWKSNPYLSQHFTGESDAQHPQWVVLDLASKQPLTAIRIAWAEPHATRYAVQYWTGDDPIHKPTQGSWQMFPLGTVNQGAGGMDARRLSREPIAAQWIRVLMTESSNQCPAQGSNNAAHDIRDCVGYAIREISLGTLHEKDGRITQFHDLVRHTPDQDQTATYCSSVDPWHESRDLDEKAGEQVGFDSFFHSGITRGLPTMIPIAMLYNTPEDAVNELRYLEARGYPISYVEMGEEADGHYTPPEDYAALYLQFAKALHQFDPKLKLGGPVFTGQNQDIEVWPNAQGDASWTRRFINHLRAHGGLDELAFFSFEHYPVDPGKLLWSHLYDEPQWVSHILQVWRDDGVPANVPLFITESNLSSQASEAYMDIWGGLWLADYVGAFLSAGGDALYFFHDLPEALTRGAHNSMGSFNFFSADNRIQQPLAQFFASQMVNLEWMQPGDGVHRIFTAGADIQDEAGHQLVSAYPALRPDGSWSLLIVNKDQENAQSVRVDFMDAGARRHFAGKVAVATFGKAQYQWHPTADGGHAEPDGPIARSSVNAGPATRFLLPAASITVLRGQLQ